MRQLEKKDEDLYQELARETGHDVALILRSGECFMSLLSFLLMFRNKHGVLVRKLLIRNLRQHVPDFEPVEVDDLRFKRVDSSSEPVELVGEHFEIVGFC